MDIKYKYKIFPELKLIIGVHFGVTTLQDLKALKIEVCNNPLYNPEYSNVCDLLDATLSFSDEEVKEYIEHVKNVSNLSKNIKTSIIANTPNQVAYSTLYSEFGKNLPINFKIASTLEAALCFLNIHTKYFSFIENEFHLLKK